jgi:hypothetical protein
MIVPISKNQVRRDEDGVWIARSALLPGCHAHGQDRGEAILRFQLAAKAHLIVGSDPDFMQMPVHRIFARLSSIVAMLQHVLKNPLPP